MMKRWEKEDDENFNLNRNPPHQYQYQAPRQPPQPFYAPGPHDAQGITSEFQYLGA